MSNLGSPLQIFARNTFSMILREMRSRFGEEKLSYAWALLEPLGWVAMMSMVFFAMGSHVPPLGDSFLVFFTSGIVPYSTYQSVSGSVAKAVKQNKPLLHFPIIKPIDVFVSRTVLSTLTQITVFFIIIGAYCAIFRVSLKADWLDVIIPFVFLGIMGFNVGIVNAVIFSYFKTWEHLWSVLTRPLFILSGIFYTIETMPKAAQDILYWNPILHCIEWIRSGLYGEFTSKFVDLEFVFLVTFGGLFIALALERFFRRKLLDD
ncbi:ABC transporter permease [Breoghania sp.]|uniref:ABC transporter permease n=1 Tax=Breoghania sp. TaxID=2065378 RepID=UPI002AAB56D1|nr:ABC transporter permease [Breoghania sp.]